MKRANPENINTKLYWNDIYDTDKKRAVYAENGTHSHSTPDKTARFLKTADFLKEKDKFIDFGCGVGVMTMLAKTMIPTVEVWGTDISDKVIKNNIKKHHPDIRYLHQYIGNQYKVPSNYFDLVFSGETLEHLEDPSDLFLDAKRVLKPGGKFILTTPKDDAIQTPEHTWYFTQQDIHGMYLFHGFKDVEFVYLPDMEHLMVIYALGVKV